MLPAIAWTLPHCLTPAQPASRSSDNSSAVVSPFTLGHKEAIPQRFHPGIRATLLATCSDVSVTSARGTGPDCTVLLGKGVQLWGLKQELVVPTLSNRRNICVPTGWGRIPGRDVFIGVTLLHSVPGLLKNYDSFAADHCEKGVWVTAPGF